jgi:hypothetical protein
MGNARVPQDGSMSGDFAYGNAQAYLQQQHAALQRQQAVLQQQQAALALQQQQLRSYGIDPALFNSNASNPNGSNVSGSNQFGQTGGGYYYASSVDGTPMMMPNQGVSQHGMASTYGMSPHHQNVGSYQNNFDDSRGGGQGFHPPNANNYRGGMSM